jgi:hypothetical protein
MHDMIRKGRDRKVRKESCIRGHELYRASPKSHGICRVCRREATYRYRDRLKVRVWAAAMARL